jgi:hypothetical protein
MQPSWKGGLEKPLDPLDRDKGRLRRGVGCGGVPPTRSQRRRREQRRARRGSTHAVNQLSGLQLGQCSHPGRLVSRSLWDPWDCDGERLRRGVGCGGVPPTRSQRRQRKQRSARGSVQTSGLSATTCRLCRIWSS